MFSSFWFRVGSQRAGMIDQNPQQVRERPRACSSSEAFRYPVYPVIAATHENACCSEDTGPQPYVVGGCGLTEAAASEAGANPADGPPAETSSDAQPPDS